MYDETSVQSTEFSFRCYLFKVSCFLSKHVQCSRIRFRLLHSVYTFTKFCKRFTLTCGSWGVEIFYGGSGGGDGPVGVDGALWGCDPRVGGELATMLFCLCYQTASIGNCGLQKAVLIVSFISGIDSLQNSRTLFHLMIVTKLQFISWNMPTASILIHTRSSLWVWCCRTYFVCFRKIGQCLKLINPS